MIDCRVAKVAVVACFAALAATAALAAQKPASDSSPGAAETWHSRGGETTWWLNRDVMRPLGLALARAEARTDAPARADASANPYLELHFAAESTSGFSLKLRGAVLDRLAAADLRHRGGPVFALPQGGEVDLRGFRLQRRGGGVFGLDVADAHGTVWFRLDHAHQYFDRAAGTFAVRYMDLRIAPTLAQRLGRPDFDGLLIGGMETTAALFQRDAASVVAASTAAACSVNWPVPGAVDSAPWADMRMIQLARNWEEGLPDGVNSYRCGRADGAGGHTLACTQTSEDGLVVLSPDASLRSDGTAAIAWAPKFSGVFPPYNNDQHPYLVWNLYRVDADGSLAQVGVSALKHAFHTINANCGCEQGEVLYPTCEDTYGGFSNDYPAALAPRSEVIAHTAQWGRCGSMYDKDCDGVADADKGVLPDDAYTPQKHMAVREADLSATRHPGARWFLEYWYVVRDDIDPYNNIGLVEIVPRKLPGQGADPNAWIWKFDAGEFRNGPMIDRWAQLAPAGAHAQLHERATAQGRVRVASRATPLNDGRWRYEWAVFNLDYSRAVTTGSEPNLRVLSNRGLIGMGIPFDAEAEFGATLFAGIGADSGDAWGRARAGSRLVWSAPASNPLDWGRSNVYTLVTDIAPSSGAVTFDDGVVTTRGLSVEALVPLTVGEPRRRAATLGEHAPH